MLDMNQLMSSLLWGTIGMGFFIYGKRQGVAPALIGGLGLIAASYFVPSAIALAAIGIITIVGTVGFIRAGY